MTFGITAPGGPWETGFVESFETRLRDELLNGEISCFGYRLVGCCRRLTLHVRADERGANATFRFQQDGDAATFAWIDLGFGCTVTGAPRVATSCCRLPRRSIAR